MRDFRLRAAAALLVLFCATGAYAQQSQLNTSVSEIAAVRNAGSIPNVIRFSGSFRTANGMAARTVESVTLSVYRDQTGGTALWQETQNVAVDAEGHYSLLMGSTQNDGVPLDLLSAGEPRWLGVQVNRAGEAEQPRVLLASVPYALKASDAETLGGRPAAAYLLADAAASPGATSRTSTSSNTGATTSTTVLADVTSPVKPKLTSGTAGYLGVFTNSTDLGNSNVFQSGGGAPGANGAVVGMGTNAPLVSLDVRTNGPEGYPQLGVAQTTSYLSEFASDTFGPAFYWDPTPGHALRFGTGGAALYNPFGFVEYMRVANTGNVGIGTTAPVAKLEVNGNAQVDGNVTITNSGNGLIFPDGSKQTTAAGGGAGGGTITGVMAGTDLTGGGLSGTVTLNVDVTKIPTLAGTNTFTASNAFTGSLSVGSLAVTATAQAANLVATQNINFSGSVLYQGSAVLQVPGGGAGNNIALGLGTLASNTSGTNNTASGVGALASNTIGGTNTADGAFALHSNIDGCCNTATGYQALQSNTTGGYNAAVGYQALVNNNGSYNTATGYQALQSNTAGSDNTAVGYTALQQNTTGMENTAVGYQALQANNGGILNALANTAMGYQALHSNTTGSFNTAIGSIAMQNSVSGIGNVAIGNGALESNTTGNNNIAIGDVAGASVSGGNGNNIDIGSAGSTLDAGAIRIGTPLVHTSFFAAGVRGVTPLNNDGIPVFVDSVGQFGTASSSRRFKDDIEDMGAASTDLMRLRPVIFRYRRPFADGSKPIQYGLIAEEVAEVYPDLVAHSADGQIETVKYQVLDSMLLNEVQKQNQHAQQQDETIRKQEAQILQQQEQNRKLEARLAALEALSSVTLSGKIPSAPTAEQ